MFVEGLTVFGFKSFHKKISLNFDQGISGIIGPNGCGKSNIVDAIRWVLGEQSTKQLRGAKMEDVIFNGSRGEKPMSIAQVELRLNNERGALPIEYSQVTVGRRLYRSGVSEYYINKNACRLKDVRELFLDTGMGSHAYSVIERSMVDNILSDNTGHRRFLFEEAAGIMKYKTRKKEALNKLEATERDLLRVNDIITEVERQVNSLRRQVGKARRHREFTTEIRDLDLSLSQIKRKEWLAAIAALESEFGSTLRVAEEGETLVASREADLEALHLDLLEREKGVVEARELLAQVDDELGKQNSRILVLRERLDATGQKIVEAQQHSVRLADRLERNHADEGERRERLVELEERSATGRSALEKEEATLSTAETKVRELRARAGESQQATLDEIQQRVRAEGAVEAVRRRLEEREGRIAELELRAVALDSERTEHAAAAEASRQTIGDARRRLQEIEEKRELLTAEIHNNEARLELVRAEHAAKREAEAAVRARLTTLEDLQSRYEGFARGVRSLMLEGERPDTVLGPLSDLVQVPGEWVRALEPALSAAWQYVVTVDTASALDLARRLREEELGFATFLPLDRVPETEAPPAGLRWASEAVSSAPEYRGLLRYLLGDLALAQDRDEAVRLVQDGRAPRAATRDGDYIDRVTVAGGEGGPYGAELLEREEAAERCRGDIDELAAAVGEIGARNHELKQNQERLRLELEEAGVAETGARDALVSLEREQAQLTSRLSHLIDSIREVEAKRMSETENREAQQAEVRSLESELSRRHEIAQEADQEHKAVSAELAEAEQSRESVLARVHDMRMSWARLEGELKDARSALERLLAERTELESERERSRKEEEESQSRKGEIREELEGLAVRVQELHELRDERAAVVDRHEHERAETAAREHQEAEALREIRKKANEARQSAHGAELQLTQLRNDLNHLEERLVGEYEITVLDLDRHEVGELPPDPRGKLDELREKLRRLGPVNLLAVEEFEEKSERFTFMSSQRDDLIQAKATLLKTIDEINKKASGMFLDTFSQVQQNFQKTFQVLFQGGECSLNLTGDDPLEADIDVTARPRGKRPQGIQQLSSGERALTAIALLFAIYLVKPSPFCILDEVDAPLDDANIDRFVAMIKKFSERTQFIMITHNKKTMEAADCLYGVTMQQPGVSSVVSVKLDGESTPQSEAARAVAEALLSDEIESGNGDSPPAADGTLSPESVIVQ